MSSVLSVPDVNSVLGGVLSVPLDVVIVPSGVHKVGHDKLLAYRNSSIGLLVVMSVTLLSGAHGPSQYSVDGLLLREANFSAKSVFGRMLQHKSNKINPTTTLNLLALSRCGMQLQLVI